MKLVHTTVTHGYYNVMGFLPTEWAGQLTRSWSHLTKDVKVGEEVATTASLAELQVVTCEGHYTSIWVAPKDAILVAKRLAVAFDREVVYRLQGKEVARFDVQRGRAVLRPRNQPTVN